VKIEIIINKKITNKMMLATFVESSFNLSSFDSVVENNDL
jgi:hypothetical protein